MDEKINQHYVPKIYQKLFSDTGKSKMVYAFRPHDEYGPSKVKHRSIERIASEDYFYETSEKFKTLSGSQTKYNELENTAFPYEKNQVLVKIINDFEHAEHLSIEITIRLLKLAFDLKRRNPSLLDGNHGYDARERLPILIDAITLRLHTENPLEWPLSRVARIKEKLLFRTNGLNEIPNLEGAFAREFGFADDSNKAELKALEEILGGTIIRSKTDLSYPFISSDNPGFTWSKAGGVHTTGFGFWEEYTFIASPRCALVAIRKPPASQIKTGLHDHQTPKVIVDEINSQTCANCLKYVYGGNESHVNLVRDQLIHLMKSRDLPNGIFKKSRAW